MSKKEIEAMTPQIKGYRSSRALKLDSDQVTKWSFTEETISEIRKRFLDGRGYNYWDQYLRMQPDLMVAAECSLKEINDPFTSRQEKKYECPTGQNCYEICEDK